MKKINILSIDGGGIRGIIPGVILTYLEKKLQEVSNTDLKLADYFDMIAGTSTGGILTCCYLFGDGNGRAKYSANDAVELYVKDGKTIFTGKMLEKLLSVLGPKYSPKPLEGHLFEMFGDEYLDNFIKPSLITSYDITQRNAVLFTSAESKDPLKNFKIKDVARATSAAPTYFPPAQIYSLSGERFNLIDGGVYANNPALCAYAEARKLAFSKVLNNPEKPDKPNADQMLMVSIGTGTVTKQYHYKDYKGAGEVKWLEPIIDILMSASSETVDYQLEHLYNGLERSEDRQDYYRVEPELFEACAEMDDASPENINNLKQAGLFYIEKYQKLLDEIANKVVKNV